MNYKFPMKRRGTPPGEGRYLKRLAYVMRAWICGLALVVYGGTGAQGREVAGKDASPSTLEREILREMNLARERPAHYADLLEARKQHFDGKLFRRPGEAAALVTKEGVKAVEEAIGYLRAARPAPPLALSAGMSQASRDHLRDRQKSRKTGHKGRDGSMPWDRVSRYGEWQKRVGENLSFGPETARDIVAAFIIDDGVASRGHRKNLFQPDFRVAGIACGPHPKWRHMCVIDYAGGFVEKK